ncbi:hypothetical protein TRFO_11313 [Tritrichomonas foetus]|uniref:NOT2/NOT3/NOT5 C-terminal domain-containing protein n=1 Tax=Tritrichomonas foetus TaxID=1144522 RepID=A0A1J4J9W2_9EUKA|nr:hypothetical protein TRFO_11313 [Tritrichomonas foetus]|eukprot:OHS94229.1 hypothetical protein TRFO_11313 [Tritrichomonas foetus]
MNSRRNNSPQLIPQPDQIGRPAVSPANIQYPPQYVQQNPLHNRGLAKPPSANTVHIDMTPHDIGGPDSLEYATPVHFNPLFTQINNPELDEEFDLTNLGIDLQTPEPLLPNISYAGSENPMVNFGQFPVSHSYPRNPENSEAINRINQFSDEALLFIFYIHARDQLQEGAYGELKKRGYSFDSEKKVWLNQSKLVFDINKWKFVPPDNTGHAPITA